MSEENTEAEDDQNNNSFLKNIYLKQIPYIIKGSKIEKIENKSFEPIPIINAMKQFKSGQVYSVLAKTGDGSLEPLNQESH